jgi:hypothetical protein
MPSEPALFHQFTLSDGSWLKVTGKHFIYAVHQCSRQSPTAEIPFHEINWTLSYAENVRVGDCLYVLDKEVGLPRLNDPLLESLFRPSPLASISARW